MFKLSSHDRSAILMDAPPPHEDPRPFIAIARWLDDRGFGAPRILGSDLTHGLVLLEDFGDVVMRSDGCSGYIRVDWFTPDGLDTWGDGRLFILGTEGYIEARKYIDIAGRPGTNHVFLVNNQKTEYFDCTNLELPYGRQLLHDIVHRTETAMPQEHCFYASELALKAQAMATRLGHLAPMR